MITSLANDRVKRVHALQTKRRSRSRDGRFVVEGVRLAEEALRAQAVPEMLLYVDRLDSRGRAVLNALRQLGAPAEEVSEEVMAACSAAETPSGLLAVLPIPNPQSPSSNSASALTLVIDGLADPGNLGTMLRTAAAAGVQAVFLAPGTVDAYNPKVVRGAMGAHFRLPIREAGWLEIETALAGAPAFLAVATGGRPYDQIDWPRPLALIVGGEAAGASPEAESLAQQRVTIPMSGGAESLNAAVAAGILMFEAVRHDHRPN